SRTSTCHHSCPCHCFSQRSRAHADLPPFPTRRSSDLARRARRRTRPGCRSASISLNRRSSCSTRRILTAPRPSNSTNRSTSSTRSEEHTSELQSRENLVCRLLLEKKKLYYTTRTTGQT